MVGLKLRPPVLSNKCQSQLAQPIPMSGLKLRPPVLSNKCQSQLFSKGSSANSSLGKQTILSIYGSKRIHFLKAPLEFFFLAVIIIKIRSKNFKSQIFLTDEQQLIFVGWPNFLHHFVYWGKCLKSVNYTVPCTLYSIHYMYSICRFSLRHRY